MPANPIESKQVLTSASKDIAAGKASIIIGRNQEGAMPNKEINYMLKAFESANFVIGEAIKSYGGYYAENYYSFFDFENYFV